MALTTETVRASLLSLADEPTVRTWLSQVIAGPTRITLRDVSMHIGRLSLHYWRPDFTPEQAKLLFQDFAIDLADATPEELAGACLQYRQDPENRFFPHPGALRDLLEPAFRQRRAERYAAERLLSVLHRTSDEVHYPKRDFSGPLSILEAAKTITPAPAQKIPSRPETPDSASSLRDTLVKRMERGA